MNKANPVQGSEVERLFANSILDHPEAWTAILKSLGDFDGAVPLKPEVIGGKRRKADVIIPFENHSPVRVNVKSFRSNYNHLERRKMWEFCKVNQIRAKDEKFLTDIWLRKAKAEGKLPLVAPEETEQVRRIFSAIEPGVSALLGSDHPQVLALYNMAESRWHLYDMNRQVVPLVRGQAVSFTAKGGNISIGDYIVIQRKGSVKGERGSHPHNIDHGSNEVQIKMKVRSFYQDVRPASHYTL